MSQSLGQGVPPNLYRVLHGAMKAPMEYAFATRSAATTARHRLYAARRRLARQGDPLSPAFDLLSITAPAERPKADGTGTEWFWRIGESVLHDALESQLEAQCKAQGIDITTLDPVRQASFDPQPSIPLAPMTPPIDPKQSFVPVPRPVGERETTVSILDEMAAATITKDTK